MIPAIQTPYKGYRFRSRLEARWALFFDALNIPWLYEPEGCQLTDCRRYLPDFKIGDLDPIWVEIKGAESTIAEHLELVQVCRGTGLLGALAEGLPCETTLWHITASAGLVRVRDTSCGLADIFLSRIGRGQTIPGVEKAASAARLARFEHGESGYRV